MAAVCPWFFSRIQRVPSTTAQVAAAAKAVPASANNALKTFIVLTSKGWSRDGAGVGLGGGVGATGGGATGN